jgi:hypothetical protein
MKRHRFVRWIMKAATWARNNGMRMRTQIKNRN